MSNGVPAPTDPAPPLFTLLSLSPGMYYLRSRAAADAIKFTVRAAGGQGDEQGVAEGHGVPPAACRPAPDPSPPRPPRPPALRYDLQVDQQALQRRKSERLTKGTSNADLKENKPAKKTAADMDEELARERAMAAMVCSLENKDACVMCSG